MFNLFALIDDLRDRYEENKILKFLEQEGKASSLLITIKTGIHGVHVESHLLRLLGKGLVEEQDDGYWSLR